jgi:myo-inositol 2-dehydrogenase/D-chiro-inositol 1-dehydrogenase
MTKLRLGVIGCGRIGKVHTQNIMTRMTNATVTMCSDVRFESAKEMAATFGIPKFSEDYKEILNSKDIDAVLICSSTDTHSQITIEAAKAKKNIFCEKPIDLALNKIDEALKAVKENGVHLQVGFNRRFDPNFRRIGEMVRKEEVGTPHLVRITSRDPAPPPAEYVKVSGGIFLDMAIHDFDMARYIINDEVEEVYSIGQNLIDPKIKDAGDYDTVVTTLKYKGGAICTIDNSRKAVYGYDQRLEVFGSRGCLVASNNRATNTEHWTDKAQTKELPLFFFLERYTESFVAEMQDFVSSITENKPVSVTGHDGRQAALIAMAAKKSAQTNRPVKISEVAT